MTRGVQRDGQPRVERSYPADNVECYKDIRVQVIHYCSAEV